MIGRAHAGTLLAGLLLTALGAVLAAEGFGWWDLDRAQLRYALPILLILIGSAAIARGLGQRRPGFPDGSFPKTPVG